MPSLDKGGAERFLTDLIINLDREIFEPSLVLFKWGGEWLKELEAKKIPVKIFRKKCKIDFFNFIQIFLAVKEIKPDIVHTQLGGDIYGRLAAKILKVPLLLSTEQNVNPDEDFLHHFLKKITSHWTDRIIAITQAVKNDLIDRYQVEPEKIVVIPNGLAISKFLIHSKNLTDGKRLADRPLIFGTIGRLSPQKGQMTLINAWAKLKNNRIDCLIAGSGKLQGEFKKLINDLNLENKVKLIGPVSTPETFLGSLDAFILPSLWEGQGVVLLEAGLVGLPIIASAVDGIKELIDETTGWLVPAGDAISLAAQIDWLADNLHSPEVINRSERLRSRIIAYYDIKKIAGDYETLYQSRLKTKVSYENITS